MLKPLIALSLAVLLSGCELLMVANVMVNCALRPEPSLQPESLPPARVGEAYEVILEVRDTSSPVSHTSVAPQQPLPEGLELHHEPRSRQAILRGTPRQAGDHEVLIYSSSYGTQCVGLSAKRLYRLKVSE
jgi:hypothetical protein